MQPLTGLKVMGALALVAGGAAVAAGCGASSSRGTGPMAALTDDAFSDLHPDAFRGARQLRLDGDATREVRRDDGSLQGTFDGTRLLAAADGHAYGTPRILDPALDVKGNGVASWNEVREVLRHFDVDASDGYDAAEAAAYQAEAGLRWIPGEST